jgi:hypothetical protein
MARATPIRPDLERSRLLAAASQLADIGLPLDVALRPFETVPYGSIIIARWAEGRDLAIYANLLPLRKRGSPGGPYPSSRLPAGYRYAYP